MFRKPRRCDGEDCSLKTFFTSAGTETTTTTKVSMANANMADADEVWFNGIGVTDNVGPIIVTSSVLKVSENVNVVNPVVFLKDDLVQHQGDIVGHNDTNSNNNSHQNVTILSFRQSDDQCVNEAETMDLDMNPQTETKSEVDTAFFDFGKYGPGQYDEQEKDENYKYNIEKGNIPVNAVSTYSRSPMSVPVLASALHVDGDPVRPKIRMQSLKSKQVRGNNKLLRRSPLSSSSTKLKLTDPGQGHRKDEKEAKEIRKAVAAVDSFAKKEEARLQSLNRWIAKRREAVELQKKRKAAKVTALANVGLQ